MDNATIAVVVSFAGLAVGQVAIIVRQGLNHRDARKREVILGQQAAAALAAAAKLVDDRTARDRQWALEDRAALAAELAAKVAASEDKIARELRATAAELALKVAADHAEVARVQRAHATELAAQGRHDQLMLAATVQKAEGVAIQAVDTLTVLVKENTLKTEEGTAAARAAYTEANHVNLKIEHLAEAGLLAQATPPWDPTQGDRRAA